GRGKQLQPHELGVADDVGERAVIHAADCNDLRDISETSPRHLGEGARAATRAPSCLTSWSFRPLRPSRSWLPSRPWPTCRPWRFSPCSTCRSSPLPRLPFPSR